MCQSGNGASTVFSVAPVGRRELIVSTSIEENATIETLQELSTCLTGAENWAGLMANRVMQARWSA
jgi:hypothetical protein